MPDTWTSLYTSRIIKAGALLADTKILLANWDEALSVSDNLERLRRENVFGKASRSRVEDILTIFRQRYLTDEAVTRALVYLVRNRFPSEGLDRILYFHSALSDALLHDVVTEVLVPLHSMGRTEVSIRDIQRAITRWVDEGKISGRWSESVVVRVAQGVSSTLRDFGVLQGTVNKRLAPMYLPVESFAYVAFYLHQRQPSGNLLIDNPEWRLFFLSPQAIERFFIEAHQLRLLQYHAAGSIIRVDFPSESIEEYAHVITQRPS